MEALTPFAQTSNTPEPIIAQVRRQLADDAPPGGALETHLLDSVAERAVRELWSSRVKIFVPVLALRQAREVLREQDQQIPRALREISASDEPTTRSPQVERPRRDALALQDDVMPHDDRDVLRV